MNGTDASRTEALLEESAWLQRLARSLVQDAGIAEDATQEALLAAEHGGPRDPRARRSWLGVTLRNSVRQALRARSRRAHHEALASARERAASSVDATLERLETQERLVQAVRALEEPYRTTITLRFLENLPPRIVAKRMGVPVKTVHTRVERGLARLRATLDGVYGQEGGRRAWATVLLPLARRPEGGLVASATAAGGGVLMSTQVKWTAAGAALVVAGVLTGRALFVGEPTRLDAAPSREALRSEPEPAEPGRAPQNPLEVSGADERRVAAGAPGPVEPAAAPSSESFRGEVVDLGGLPVAGLEVALIPTSRGTATLAAVAAGATGASEPVVTTVSAPDGSFELPLVPERGRLVAAGGSWATVLFAGYSGTPPPEPPRIVVGPARSYAGRVVDTAGLGVAQAELRLWPGSELSERFRRGGLWGPVDLFSTETDADGRFEVGTIGFAPGLALSVEANGFERTSLELPPASSGDLVIELTRPGGSATSIGGVVVDALGQPVPEARVSYRDSIATTDERGMFALSVDDASSGDDADVVRAAAPGWLPVSLELGSRSAAERNELVLTLTHEPRSIEGTVLDAKGRSVAGAEVWSDDTEHFGQTTQRFGELAFVHSLTTESLMAGAERREVEATTDERGRFRIPALLDRAYTLWALHPETLESTIAELVPAGTTNARLAFRGTEELRRVAGRVLTRSGEPVSTAIIRVNRMLRLPGGGRRFRSGGMHFGASTDSEGRFLFESLAIDGTSLLLNGEDVPGAQRLALDGAGDLEDIVFVVPERCHLRIQLDDPEAADTFELLDENGVKLNLSFMRGSITLGSQAIGIADGESPLTQTDDSARTLVLYKEGEEVLRIPIELTPGEVNELRY